MNCQNHADLPATAYCRTCGKPVCNQCRYDAAGTVFCQEHAPVPAAAPPPPAAPPPQPSPYTAPHYPGEANASPGWALALGLMIPGVGAIYNGQYAKGLVHAVVFGLLVSLISAGGGMEPLLGMLLSAWIFYMGFEAYHTALKRRRGEPVDEFSSILNVKSDGFPVAGVALIGLGVLLLLNTLDLINFRYVARYWPVLLIAAGAWLLWVRVTGTEDNPGVRHER
jgi:hypothetical protein